jgi:hypothetical protein
MIRKYLVIGKHLHLSSKRIEDPTGNTKVPIIELLLPLEVFWEIEDLLARIDYLTAAGEDQVQLNDCYARIYKKIGRYTLHEKDRGFVAERIQSFSGNS